METDDTVVQKTEPLATAPVEPLRESHATTLSRHISTKADLLHQSQPHVALDHEEQERTRRASPLMAAFGVALLCVLPVFDGTGWAKLLVQVTLAFGLAAMGWLWWTARLDSPIKRWQLSTCWYIVFVSVCATMVFFGVSSPGTTMVALALALIAQGQSVGLARIAYLTAMSIVGLIGFLDVFAISRDPGMIRVTGMGRLELFVGHFLIQGTLLSAYLLGRYGRQSSSKAITKVQSAMRELAQQEVLIREAKDDVQRALNIGGVGRLSGQTVGNYRLFEIIGHGGMGEVYRAEHQMLATPAAVKIIHRHLCLDEELSQRFIREAQLSASLESSHIVRVLDAGYDLHGVFIAMELLSGQDLATRLRHHGLLSLGELQQLAAQIGRGIDIAAKESIVHRDIKPQNLFRVHEDERADAEALWKILDFGVARASTGESLTQTSSIIGTPSYMSPEQATGGSVDHRCDLHALTSVLYRACTGFAPFTGDNGHAVLYSVVHHKPEPPSKAANLPVALDAFFAKGFAKDPDARYQSGDALARALSAACASKAA